MKTTEEIIEQRVAEFKAQLLKELTPKVEFEVGKCVYISNANGGACGCEGCIGKITTKPTDNNYSGCFKDESDLFIELIGGRVWAMNSDSTTLRSVTESEIKEALIKEAEKRGFKEGVVVERTNELLEFNNTTSVSNVVKIEYKKFTYNETLDTLEIDGRVIYGRGKWATIVKEEAIKIGGYEVRFIVNNETTIDGWVFTKKFWEAAKVVATHDKACIKVGCSKQFDVSLETINAILEKL